MIILLYVISYIFCSIYLIKRRINQQEHVTVLEFIGSLFIAIFICPFFMFATIVEISFNYLDSIKLFEKKKDSSS